MKICLIGPANSSHIVKLCKCFKKRGHDVYVISFIEGVIPEAKLHIIDLGVDQNGNDINKLKYLLSGRRIKGIIDSIEPDVINVHYATSYGAAVALSGVKRYVLSVWGSDVYVFPNKSFFHKCLLKYSLWKAPLLFSTSKAMAFEAKKYTNKHFEITPFGVDLGLFTSNKRTRMNDSFFIIGTIKALSDIYGIDILLRAVEIIHKEYKNINIRVRIAGDGPDKNKYYDLAHELEIDTIVDFLGFIPMEKAAEEWANMDVAVFPSKYESFGVAAVEAQACKTPVIISDISGLKEATLPGRSSLVLDSLDPRILADAIIHLYYNSELRDRMAEAGRKYVEENYCIDDNIKDIERLLTEFSNQI